MRRGTTIVGLCLVLALGVVAPAHAAVQVGETFDPDGSGTCIAGRTLLQLSSPGGQYAASAAGVITGWSHRTAPLSAPAGTVSALKLKVGRPIGGANYTIVGESAVETTVPGALNSFSTRIPVEAGDLIGLHVLDNGACLRNQAGYGSDEFNGDPTPGTTVTLASPFPAQLDISATLEPDCDSDGFGDETQDQDTLSCPPGPATTITSGPNDKTKKKQATFEFTASEPGATFECSLDGGSFAACSSPYSFKVKKGKHHFEVRASDAGGNVGPTASDDWKVKKKRKE